MKKLILLFLLITTPAFATVQVMRFPTGKPVHVCLPSDSNSNCGGSGGSSSNTSGWTDVSARVQLVDSTDNVSIGSATTGGKLYVVGDTDEKQLQVKSNATQTNAMASFETSAGADIFQVANTGLTSNVTFTGTTFVGALTGNATTSTSLAANGANCSAGSYPLGVDASGAVEDCTVAGTGGSADSIAYHKITPPLTSHGIGFGSFTNIWTSGVGNATFFTLDTGSSDTIFQGDGDIIMAGKLGIGTTAVTNLDISGSGTALLRAINTTASSSTQGAGIQGVHNDGAAMASGDRLAFYTFGGATDGSSTLVNGGAITGFAADTWNGTSAPTEVRIEVAPSGSTTRATALTVESDKDVVAAADLTVTGGDVVLGTTNILSGGDTASLNEIDAINSTTETTLEAALDLAGDVSSTGMSSTAIGADKVTEAMLKAVNSAVDEDILSYETTTGDFEWHTCAEITGSADLCDGSDATGGGGGAADSIAYHKITSPLTNSGIDFGAFTNVWTNTTGNHVWTGANTSGDYFKVVGTGAMAANGSVAKISNTGNALAGSALLQLDNADTDMLIVKSNNFSVAQNGDIAGRTATLTGAGTPTLSTCGTSPTVSGTNSAFTVTVGSGHVGNCTATFSSAFTITPTCQVGWQSGQALTSTWTSSTSNLIFNQNAMGGKKADIICIGH